MAWQDRLKEAAWTSPSGNRFVWLFENVSRSVEKKGAVWEFPDAEKITFVQDLGATGRKYPMRVIFNGDDHDLVAESFLNALEEVGISKLEHPLYGEKDVAVIGTVSSRDDLKTAANQSVFEFTAWETIRSLYDFSTTNLASEVVTQTDSFNETASEGAASKTETDTVAESVTLRQKYNQQLNRVKTALQPLYDTVAELQQAADAVEQAISATLNTLVGDPLLYFQQLTILLDFGARAETLVKNKLAGYENLARSIIDQASSIVTGTDSSNNDSNNFQADDVVALAAVTGQALSIVSSEFQNQQEAIEAADGLNQLFDEVTAWRDQNYQALEQIDEGATYQAALNVVQTASAYLIEQSFSLPQKRSLILINPRTLHELAAELFGEVDERIDELIILNNLVGDEILLIPKGREIVYFV